VTTPPDFGGHEIEEGLLEDLGGPQENYPVSHQDEAGTDFSDNELHAAGQTCPRCGTVIQPGQDVRRHANASGYTRLAPPAPDPLAAGTVIGMALGAGMSASRDRPPRDRPGHRVPVPVCHPLRSLRSPAVKIY
jgi:hypothetical protein